MSTTTAPRAGVGLGLLVAAVGMIAAVWVPLFGGTAGAQSSNVTITQTGGLGVGPCIGQNGLSYTVFSDSSTFRLRVVAPSDPCQPINATAAIYAMPGGGAAWPQTLKEAVPFTISEAGVTNISFAKTCTPVQFDVVTGATPQVITPLGGQMHGPLLFPADINTAFQDPGAVCTTTTTAGPTTTVAGQTTAAPTTTSAVLDTTIVNTTPSAAVVQGSSDDRGPGGTTGTNSPGSALAVTGGSSSNTAAIGGVLLAAGVVLILVSRYRMGPHAHMITSVPSVDPNSPFSVD